LNLFSSLEPVTVATVPEGGTTSVFSADVRYIYHLMTSELKIKSINKKFLSFIKKLVIKRVAQMVLFCPICTTNNTDMNLINQSLAYHNCIT
jgi:valyl-tRNA synthetase